MKAMLIVDIPNEMINDTTCVTITSLHSGMSFNAKLKPIPDKLDWKIGYGKDKNTCVIYNKNYVDGFNKCIDEILGDE